jgi:putative hydrolase of the HAD superfamily
VSPPAGAPAATSVKAVIFDMGGILEAPFDDVLFAELAQLLGIPEPQLRRERSAHGLALTLGRMTLRDFYARVAREAGSPVGADAAVARHLALYESATGPLDAGVLALVQALRQRYVVACLTNTEVEVGRFNRDRDLYRAFDRAFLSTELRLHKPDRAIFDHVVAELRCPAADAVFTDDKLENVVGARTAGLHAIQFRDLASFSTELTGLIGRWA